MMLSCEAGRSKSDSEECRVGLEEAVSRGRNGYANKVIGKICLLTPFLPHAAYLLPIRKGRPDYLSPGEFP
jgi:hypothetical protein